MKKKRVAIDVGHARMTGARGCGLEEHEVCVRIGAALATALRELGMEADVIDFPGLTNAGDMAEAARVINAGGYDLSVSVHCDANANALARGGHVIYKSARGGRCAGLIARRLCALMPGRAEQLVRRPGLYMLRATRPVAVLVECGFLTNWDDARVLGSEGGVERVAGAIARGVKEYFEQE